MDARDGILKAAEAVFARHGFRQTAMAMVAEQAGLTRQALYHHFASKEALFAALVDALQENALASAKAAAARGGGDLSETVYRIMLAHHKSFVASVAGSPFAAELVEEGNKRCASAVAAHARRFEKELEAAIAAQVRAGRFVLRTGVAPRDLAEMATVAAKGVKVVYAAEGELRYAQALKRMIEVVCAGAAKVPAKAMRTGKLRRTGS